MTVVMLEREIKLRFRDAAEAREAVIRAGATPLRSRRLQEDALLDTDDELLRRQRCVLRVRVESGRSQLTFKGPVQPSLMKVREELETLVNDGTVLVRVFESLGFHVWFRYEKYREEFAIDDVIVAIDETPVGTFVELDGGERGIQETAVALGRAPSDYLLDSYRRIYILECESRGVAPADMLFAEV
ncbi:MAG TPA: class IV adenylate cyclase [Vicinamibacterales bacterium]|nr:class IV adenylate cyclase [Vicinamibacterales bacterium]